MRTPLILVATLVVACADPPPSPDAGTPDAATDAPSEDTGAPDGGGEPMRGAFVVTPASTIHLVEGGAPHTFSIRLADAPTSDVTLTLASSDTSAATVSPTTLTFGPTDFDASQMITVTPVDDADEDGAQPFVVVLAAASSTDARYDGLDPADIAGTVVDDEIPGVVASAVQHALTEGGSEVTFTVRLAVAPTAPVSIPLVTSDATEGTVSPPGLVFTAANWSVPQTVTVTSVDDAIIDGIIRFAAELRPAISNDRRYQHLDADDVPVDTIDDDSAGVVTSALEGALCDVSGSTTTFAVALTAEPSVNVVVPLTTSGAPIALSASALTFTPGTWNVPQTVTVAWDGTNVAAAAPGLVGLGHVITNDSWFVVIDPDDVPVTLCDAENEAIIVGAPGGGALAQPLVTHEVGIAQTFTVALAQPPSSPVTITLEASDDDEITIEPASLTFTATTFATPQTVTLTGHGDGVIDGTSAFTLALSAASDDEGYARLDPVLLAVENSTSAHDLALGKPVVVTCRAGATTCPGTDAPGEINDGSASTAYLVVESGGSGALCGVSPFPACTTPSTRPTLDVDLGHAVDGIEVVLTCAAPTTGPMPVPLPVLAASADGTTFSSVAYTSGSPTVVPNGTRYLRVQGGLASLAPVSDLWATGINCSVLTATANVDL